MSFIRPVTLNGEHAMLAPLSLDHCGDLTEAVKDGELWRLWYTMIPVPEKMQMEIERRLQLQANGIALPFAVIDRSTGKASGLTSYLNVDAPNRRVEIGGTWYRKRLQRTAVNTECKLLLLAHAFEQLNCIAVEFRTSFFNRPSRTGIERLGAKLDGVLRNHLILANGTLRDTCVYSIIAGEWPSVKANLEFQLARKSRSE